MTGDERSPAPGGSRSGSDGSSPPVVPAERIPAPIRRRRAGDTGPVDLCRPSVGDGAKDVGGGMIPDLPSFPRLHPFHSSYRPCCGKGHRMPSRSSRNVTPGPGMHVTSESRRRAFAREDPFRWNLGGCRGRRGDGRGRTQRPSRWSDVRLCHRPSPPQIRGGSGDKCDCPSRISRCICVYGSF
jgi:hypothetical protein